MKNVIKAGLVLCMATLNSYAQQTPAVSPSYDFTLADCIQYAYLHQDTIVNARLDVKSAEYKVKETTGIGLPQINGSASFLDYVKIPTTLIPGEFIGQPGTYIPLKFGVKYQSNLGLDASQILFDGSYLVGLKASKTYKELSQRNVTRSLIEANVQVTKAYYQVLVSGESIKLLDANIKQIKEQYDQTAAQNKQGFVEKIDVDRVSVQLNDLVTTRANTLRLLVLNIQMLKFQMGMPIETQLTLKDKLEDVKLEETETILAATDTAAYHKRVEYSLYETQLKLNKLDLQRQKSQFLPTLSAVANYTSSYQNNSFNTLYNSQFPSSYIGINLKVPIFNGFQRTNQVKQAKISVQKTQNDMDNLKNALNLQTSAARIGYINGLQTLNNQKHNREVAEEVLRVSRIKYQQGVGSSIEVTQAETSLVTADNSYIQGLYNALISKVDLDRAYGRIQ
ncbi:TolC family protein [Mucilaginibacter jinjuensis]|uniref:TolC family protein n=1 Tax=Mucilaginibacter jinjuensis TaxID=1176721 RepID=A0ABY7T4W0_9SPHI|nr:TolC family protein [Mucilaginibacter jinjuensis]WCT10282.1 TolC family protein [Mucilaginibacter jinjuensis]